MVDLSILVCSIHTRHDSFLLKIEKQIFEQYNALSEADQQRVEVLVLTDNKQMVLGHKRNTMVAMAQGKYVAFVDDDDRISDDYIQQLLDATSSDADAIVFQAKVSLNGGPAKTCYYSKDNQRDFNRPDAYYRIPNHICCVKRTLASAAKFPDILFGEDAHYAKQLLPLLETEHKINSVLYYYDYNILTTSTRVSPRKPQPVPVEEPEPEQEHVEVDTSKPIVDVVILSRADTHRELQMTQKAIDSCVEGAGDLPVNVIVIENSKNELGRYHNATTFRRTGAFNYNGFANYGAEQGQADWVMVANNDLVFEAGWLQALLDAQHDVVSPREPNDPRQVRITKNTLGDVVSTHFSGWCFMIKRTLWEHIGKFDTDVTFWCSDDAVIEQVKAAGVMPMIVYKSIVHHYVSKTLGSVPKNAWNDLKWRNVYIFNKKYGKEKFISDQNYIRWLQENVS